MSQTFDEGVRPSLVGEAFVFTPAALECGTLTIKPMRARVRQYNSCSFESVGVEPRAGGWIGPGTLLGPEISVAQPLLGGCRGSGFSADQCRPHRVVGLRYRPCVENFTVDASIFVVTTSY